MPETQNESFVGALDRRLLGNLISVGVVGLVAAYFATADRASSGAQSTANTNASAIAEDRARTAALEARLSAAEQTIVDYRGELARLRETVADYGSQLKLGERYTEEDAARDHSNRDEIDTRQDARLDRHEDRLMYLERRQ